VFNQTDDDKEPHPSNNARKQQPQFFTMNERDSKKELDFKARTSQYNKVGIKQHPDKQQESAVKDRSKLTLA